MHRVPSICRKFKLELSIPFMNTAVSNVLLQHKKCCLYFAAIHILQCSLPSSLSEQKRTLIDISSEHEMALRNMECAATLIAVYFTHYVYNERCTDMTFLSSTGTSSEHHSAMSQSELVDLHVHVRWFERQVDGCFNKINTKGIERRNQKPVVKWQGKQLINVTYRVGEVRGQIQSQDRPARCDETMVPHSRG